MKFVYIHFVPMISRGCDIVDPVMNWLDYQDPIWKKTLKIIALSPIFLIFFIAAYTLVLTFVIDGFLSRSEKRTKIAVNHQEEWGRDLYHRCSFYFTSDSIDVPEIICWLNENTPSWNIIDFTDIPNWIHKDKTYDGGLHLLFKHDTDALAFKLRWE